MNRRTAILALLALALGAGSASAFRGGFHRGGGRGGGFHHGGGHHSYHHSTHRYHAHHASHHMHHHMHHVHHARHMRHHWWHVRARRIVFGTWLLTLPARAALVYAATRPYYYSDGTYYVKKSETVYVTVPAPAGAVIKELPDGATQVKQDGEDFWYYVGAFYKKTGDGYLVVAAPEGATVSYKPKDAKAKTIKGATYYVYADVYYKPRFVDGLTLYQVVAKPATKKAADVLDKIPDDNITVKHGGTSYYYADGDWYEAAAGGYQKIKAVVGASVPYISSDAEKKGGGYAFKGATYEPYQKDGVTLYRVTKA